ncbi:SGNH/GDSL hydrolase family protein [Hymenobacter sp. ASUV-10]|uniref:SGNH/GDSL hydrolase family protein n=1 Tax=Hymenobacter aranciens TaxID=3063996 RepID=A0ABT9B632_9BACT|nr:SGNH/GDSL hydrolase family protein [Hymenobacter sp. ASUV-10]MDO7873250.1 SGNH/GDSL hydrolase family protein [Hymenobacter sp. ASUV-10]
MKPVFNYAAAALGLMGLGLTSCQPDIDDPKSSAGQADFTTYLAVGNSLTAGFSDNGLYLEGQQNSYPSILAQQFAKVGGGAFVQPLFPAANSNGSGYLSITGFSTSGTPTLGPVAPNAGVGIGADNSTPLLVKYTGTDNQNLGVPGIRVADVTTPGYGYNNPSGFNPYFERLLAGPSALFSYQQYVEERVTTLKPTFFTNWLGNNDVLGYATSGGTAPLTGVALFTTKYTAITDVLTAGGAKGLLATIPNVVNVPFFTTVPTANVIGLINNTPIPTALEPAIKAALGLPQSSPLPTGLRFGFYITTGTGAKRLATSSDLLLLTAQAAINVPSTNPLQPFPSGVGLEIPGAPAATAAQLAATSNALDSRFVLDAAEVTSVQNRTAELNTVITNVANQKGLALFDSNTFFRGVATNGLVINGVNNTAAFVSGNLFSLDGVHPTPRGYAVIANEMIKAINAKYGAAVPGVDATAYRGVRFPQ